MIGRYSVKVIPIPNGKLSKFIAKLDLKEFNLIHYFFKTILEKCFPNIVITTPISVFSVL